MMSWSWAIIALSSRRTQSQLAKEKPDSGAGEMLSVKRTELASQHTHGGSQLSINSSSGGSDALSVLHGHKAHMWYTYIHVNNTFIYQTQDEEGPLQVIHRDFISSHTRDTWGPRCPFTEGQAGLMKTPHTMASWPSR